MSVRRGFPLRLRHSCHDEVTFPVTGHCPVVSLGGTLTEHHLVRHRSGSFGVALCFAFGSARAQGRANSRRNSPSPCTYRHW